MARLHPSQQLAITVDGRVEARHVQLFRFRRQFFKCQRFERTYTRHDSEKSRQYSRSNSRPLIAGSPILFVAGTRQIVKEFLSCDTRDFLPDLLALDLPRNFGKCGKDRPDRAAVRSDREIEIQEEGLDL